MVSSKTVAKIIEYCQVNTSYQKIGDKCHVGSLVNTA